MVEGQVRQDDLPKENNGVNIVYPPRIEELTDEKHVSTVVKVHVVVYLLYIINIPKVKCYDIVL